MLSTDELLEIGFVYWDGANLKKKIRVFKKSSFLKIFLIFFKIKKKTKISEFLEIIRRDLAKDYSELRNMTHDGLLYIVEDTIIPLVLLFFI